MPATVNAGDLLLMVFANDDATTQTTPTGWTLLDSGSPNNQVYGGVYAKDAAGTEGGTTVDVVTAAAQEACAQVYRITGWKGTLGTDVTISTAATGTDANPNSGSVSASESADNLFIAAVCNGDDEEGVNFTPSSYTNTTETVSGSVTANNLPAVATARREKADISDDPLQWTLNGIDQWIAWTIVIEPAADAASSLPLLGSASSGGF
jgi:hypothetical protein